LCGYRPYEDIDVRFTGLRPGEKLSEELRAGDERLVATDHPGLRVLRNGRPPVWADIAAELRQLERAAVPTDSRAVRGWLTRLVPEYAGLRPGDVAIMTGARAAGARSA